MNNNPYQAYPWEYDHWYDRHRPVYLSELKALKEALPSAGVGLEIGVGTGRFAGALGIEWGVDPAREMLFRAKARGLKVIQGNGEVLPFDSRSFDYLVMVTVLCFFSHPDRVVKEAHRVLKEGGRLIIGFVDRESYLGMIYQEKKSKSRFYRDAEFYSVPDVLRLLPSSRWREIEIRQTLFESAGRRDAVQTPREGWGDGGFVVVSGGKRQKINIQRSTSNAQRSTFNENRTSLR